jgi:hypothetical protein
VEWALTLPRQPLLELLQHLLENLYLSENLSEENDRIEWILALFWRLDHESKETFLSEVDSKIPEVKGSRSYCVRAMALKKLRSIYQALQKEGVGFFFYPMYQAAGGVINPQQALFDVTFRTKPEGGFHDRYLKLRSKLGETTTWVDFFTTLSDEIDQHESDFYPPKTERARHVIAICQRIFGGSLPDQNMIDEIRSLALLWKTYSNDPNSVFFRVSKPLFSREDLPSLSKEMSAEDLLKYVSEHVPFIQGLSLSQQAAHFWDMATAYRGTFDLTEGHLAKLRSALDLAKHRELPLEYMFLLKIHERASGAVLDVGTPSTSLGFLRFDCLPAAFEVHQPSGLGHGNYKGLQSQLDECESLFEQWEVLLSHQEESTRPKKWWDLSRKEWLDGSRGKALRRALLEGGAELNNSATTDAEKRDIEEALYRARWDLVTRAPNDPLVHAKQVSPLQQRRAAVEAAARGAAATEVDAHSPPTPVTTAGVSDSGAGASEDAARVVRYPVLPWHAVGVRSPTDEGAFELPTRTGGASGGAGAPGFGGRD